MKLLIGGDVVPKETNEKYFIEGDVKTLFGKTVDLAEKADRVIINLECALTSSEEKIKKIGPNLRADERCVNAVKKFGVTDAMLANNHAFDHGETAFLDTLDTLESAGMPYVGGGRDLEQAAAPVIMEKGGMKIGFLAATQIERNPNPDTRSRWTRMASATAVRSSTTPTSTKKTASSSPAHPDR